jgi:hypothetical protein
MKNNVGITQEIVAEHIGLEPVCVSRALRICETLEECTLIGGTLEARAIRLRPRKILISTF